MNNIFLALDTLFTRYLNLVRDETGNLPKAEFDPPWPSPCMVEAQEVGQDAGVFWRPTSRDASGIFEGLESAMGWPFRPEISQFYGAFWANGICVQHGDLCFDLIQIWNEEDEENLKENMLGHLFAKKKNRLPFSFFMGSASGNNVIALEQESGHVVLEKPGYKAHQILAENLEQFLLNLDPTTELYAG